MRIPFTIALSTGFLVLLVTGVLMYTTRYNYFTSSLHVWSALLVLLSVGFHFSNNWKPYKAHLNKRIGKQVFALTAVGVVVISLGLILEKAPFSTLVDVGKQLRNSASLEKGSF